MIICNKCGTRNGVSNSYCTNCHQLFTRTPQQTPPSQIKQSPLKTIRGHALPNMDERKKNIHTSFRDLIEDESHKKDDSQAYTDQRVPPPKDKINSDKEETSDPIKRTKSYNKLFGVLFLITVPAMLYLAYFILGLSVKTTEETTQSLNSSASAIFVQAENHFNEKRYLAAQNIYVQFMDDFPNDPLAEIVSSRIKEINGGLLTIEEESIYKKHRLKLLMKKAETAYDKHYFLTPANDNVFIYISEALSIDPHQSRAIELQKILFSYYTKKGEEALARREYYKAKEFYKNGLTIFPDDINAQKQVSKINNLITKMEELEKSLLADAQNNKTADSANQQSSFDKRSQQTNRIAESNSNKDTGKLVSQEQTDSQSSMRQNSGGNASTASLNPKGLTTTPSERPALSEIKETNVPTFTEPVIESFLDTGRRQYLKKEAPKYPGKFLKARIQGLVLLEVIVRKDGRVAGHRVIQSTNGTFTSACVKALRGFRYKTGTIKGIPVSFKAVERFEFKVDNRY